MRRRWTAALAIATAAASAGCSKKEPARDAAPASALPVVAAAASAPSSAPAASAAPPAKAAEAPAVPPSKLVLVAESDGAIRVLPGANRALIQGDTDYEIIDDAPTMNGHVFDSLAAYRKEGSFAGSIVDYGGRWPEAAWADLARNTERGNTNRDVFQWQGSSWGLAIDFGQWSEVTAVAPYTVPGPDGPRTSLVAGSVGGFMKRAVQIVATKGTRFQSTPFQGELCETRLATVYSLSATPDGSLFAVGDDCKDQNDLAVERFSPDGASKGVTTPPPGLAFLLPAEGEVGVATTIAAVSPTEAYLTGQTAARKPYFAAFDGAKWAPASLGPIQAPLNALRSGPDGTLWAVSAGKLFRKVHGAAWTPVELPEGARVTDVDAPATDVVWAWGPSGEKGTAVYRSRPFKEVLKLKEAKLERYSAECKTIFVVLYTISTTAAPDYDFPATRKALKGHTELAGSEFLVTTSYQFGAIVPDQDRGKKLIAAVKAEVKGSKPQLVCMRPNIGRRFAFDLATGDVKPLPVDTTK
jgi:hypothetical protein